jgi:LysM repeat protein
LLCAVIFGPASFFAYQLFIRPQRLEKEDIAQGPATPPPDPSLPELAKCEELQNSGKLVEARTALMNFVENNPDSTKIEEAKAVLGQINTAIFFSTYPAPEKVEYSVQKGDVLMKIAMKMKTTSELIMRSNNMSGTMLHIGQHLLVSQPNFSIVISRKEKKVTLLNDGKFFKQFSALTWGVPPARSSAAITGKVREKIAWRNGVQVPLGSKDYPGSARWVEISVANYTLYSQGSDNSAKPPGGIELSQEAMEELSTLLSRNVPVTIQ